MSPPGHTPAADSERPYTYEGSHVLASTETDEGTIRLVLSRPAKQGDGGIWCAERWYETDGATNETVRDFDLTSSLSVYGGAGYFYLNNYSWELLPEVQYLEGNRLYLG